MLFPGVRDPVAKNVRGGRPGVGEQRIRSPRGDPGQTAAERS